LAYRLEWPLDLFLNQADISTYQSAFAYLVALRRVSARLHSLWLGRRSSSKGSNRMWAAAGLAVFLLECMWSYFQANVIDVAFEGLKKDLVLDEMDPERLRVAHGRYLEQIRDGLCLGDERLMSCMRRLCLACEGLVGRVSSGGAKEDGNQVRSVVTDVVRTLEEVGGKKVDVLLMNLEGIVVPHEHDDGDDEDDDDDEDES